MVELVGLLLHPPLRPGWTCQACGREWPCPPAREELVAVFADDSRGLLRFMVVQMNAATVELGEALTMHELCRTLYVQFMAWVPQRVMGR